MCSGQTREMLLLVAYSLIGAFLGYLAAPLIATHLWVRIAAMVFAIVGLIGTGVFVHRARLWRMRKGTFVVHNPYHPFEVGHVIDQRRAGQQLPVGVWSVVETTQDTFRVRACSVQDVTL
jgi:hypothetical protein